ncbi:MAG: cupin domain-containing protein [Candidatus Nanopelagicales bacterium]|nr:cupin domain-containing protein [Candidatus Nanopelagicales bacterium]MCF8536983.1 cupin domain-containing protein [Candidatus Nanopelagicales bacterium]MCF8543406.1 cupin domain-containing protein [Candidatus Nanopelagicales bacterium]MCF8556840.1 cupin domain-containing protein [Candidatus Nanopelagicales bacterium]
MARYRSTHNPATGERIQYTVTGLESAGALVRYRWISEPGGRIVDHTHPSCAEIFTILDGEATLTVAGERILLAAGQSAVVPAGVMHSEENISGQLVHGIVELTPASQTAELHDALAGISTDLPHTAAGAPRNLLQLGATFWAFRDDIRASSPPVWLQNLMLPVLAGAARVAGVTATRPEWSSRLAPGETAPPLFDESRFGAALAAAGYDFALETPRPLHS